jgi:virulence-associated protein VapD
LAYNFLDLVNHVNHRLNEVPLTESNFASAGGFYSTAKNAVNNAIRDINTREYQWPFNHRTGTFYAETDGRVRYPLVESATVVDMDTFRIRTTFGDFHPDDFHPDDFYITDTESSRLQWLSPITYDKYVAYYSHYEYNISSATRPRFVFLTQDRQIGIAPSADLQYLVEYEYWVRPSALVAYNDVPTIPEDFKYVIEAGSMYYAYFFRERTQDAVLMRDEFKEGIKDLRNVYINNHVQVTSRRRIP